MKYCKCGSMIIDGNCTNSNCEESGKKYEWIINGKPMKFSTPVRYDDAVKLSNVWDNLFNEEENHGGL